MMSDTSPKKRSRESLIELASKIIREVEIKNIILAQSNCGRSPDASDRLEGAELTYSISRVGFGFDRESSTLHVIVEFSFKAQDLSRNVTNDDVPQDSGDDATVAWITANFVALYDVTSEVEVTDEGLEAFAVTNGVFNLWPFWRQHVLNLGLQMGFTGLTAPLHRV